MELGSYFLFQDVRTNKRHHHLTPQVAPATTFGFAAVNQCTAQMHAQRWGQDSPEIVDFRRVLEINNLHQQITRCEGARDVCALIDARATEFGPANVSNTFRKLTVLETVSSRNSPIAKSSNQAEDREPDTILVIDSDNPPSFVHSGIIFGMNWCINGIKFHILFHTIVMISYQMRWETARHSSVFPKLENGLDRGAPCAKTKH